MACVEKEEIFIHLIGLDAASYLIPLILQYVLYVHMYYCICMYSNK